MVARISSDRSMGETVLTRFPLRAARAAPRIIRWAALLLGGAATVPVRWLALYCTFIAVPPYSERPKKAGSSDFFTG